MPLKPISDIFRANSYRDTLNSEEWKSFSRTIRARRGNACQSCRRSGVVTQVHHIFYDPKLRPWEYKDEDLVLLCESCHRDLHQELSKFRRYVFGKFNADSMRVVNGALSVALDKYEPIVFAHALAEFVSTPSMVQRYADAWGVGIENRKGRPVNG